MHPWTIKELKGAAKPKDLKNTATEMPMQRCCPMVSSDYVTSKILSKLDKVIPIRHLAENLLLRYASNSVMFALS